MRKPPGTAHRRSGSARAAGRRGAGSIEGVRSRCRLDASGQSTPPAGTFENVSAGWGHTCGVTSTGSVECWGMDGRGQSTPPAGTFETVSAGSYHTCGVTTSGSVECWGRNGFGQSTPPEL